MLESTMAAAAGGAGGLLGQLGDVLSAPRRFAWDALGLPDSGAELLHRTFGMDPESGWTKALGLGAEAALDPLTYAGMLMGGPLAKAGASALNARRAAPLAEEVAGLAAARRAAAEGLVQRAAGEAETAARIGTQAGHLEAAFDLPGIAGGRTRTYNSFTNALADDMTNSGLATLSPDGAQLTTLGHSTPAGVEMNQLQMGRKGQMSGSVMDHEGRFPSPAAEGARHNRYTAVDPLLPDQLAWIQNRTQERLGNRWRQLADPEAAYNKSHLMDEYAAAMTADANATRPMPTLGTHMRDQFLPTSPYTPQALAAPLPDAFSATQAALADALARKKAFEESALATALTRADYAKLAGGSYLASIGLGSGGR